MDCTCGHDFFNHYAQDQAPEKNGRVKQCRFCSDCEAFEEAK